MTVKLIKERVDKTGRHFLNLYRCFCGNTFKTRPYRIKTGYTRSCGCLYGKNSLTHGHSAGLKPSSTYNSWASMKRRCSCKTSDNWKYYGGRGIKVCARWSGSFENFLNDMGERPIGTTLHRVDNDGNYTIDNCIWLSEAKQRRYKNNAVYMTLNGTRKLMLDWCEELGLKRAVVYLRHQRGWPDHEALLGRGKK